MPKWPNPSYTNIMIGTHADSLVAEAINKGFTASTTKPRLAGCLQRRDDSARMGHHAAAGTTANRTLPTKRAPGSPI
jgi:hypothetical protein